MHALLERQVKRCFGNVPPTGPAWARFLDAIADAYAAEEADRKLLEHAIDLSSRELVERNESLSLDIERRKRAESERDAFFRLSPDLLCIVSFSGVILQTNPTWSSLGHAASELEGRHFCDVVAAEDRQLAVDATRTLVETQRATRFETRVHGGDGRTRVIEWSACAEPGRERFVAIGRDVTQQRILVRELAQAHKLEAVGQLASGVAHEINTPLQFVSDNLFFVVQSFGELKQLIAEVQTALEQKTLDTEHFAALATRWDLDFALTRIPRSLADSTEGVERVAELVRALKEYAHPDPVEMVPADINLALERTLVLSRSELKHLAAIETDFGPLPPLTCHIGSLNQAFLNLVINAAHAIEEVQKKNGHTVPGSIFVTTRVEAGEAVVSVRDTGNGIPEAIRERIFEPFFTTKPIGKGSGQGLPLVRAVVEKHRGSMAVDSEVGVGSTFTIRLPLEKAA